MIRIVEPIDGAILNRNDGRLTSEGLEITVRGVLSERYSNVWVNENRAEVNGNTFTCHVALENLENRIVAFARGVDGEPKCVDTVTVIWDKNSVKRYRVSVDDNIIFLKDLALNAQKYRSIFDNEFLSFWKDVHDRYGAKIHFNIFYQTEGFDLSKMPSKYKSDWLENRDWLRLTFHALQEKPDLPYKNATYGEMKHDYLLVTKEIERFAGRELLSSFTTIHWGEAPLEACIALRNCGIKGLVGYFTWNYTGPSPYERIITDKPCVSYYLDNEVVKYLSRRDYWMDLKAGITFIRHDIVINTLELDQITQHLNMVAEDPHQSEVMELMIHEQQFYRSRPEYQPDYEEKVIEAVKWVANKGYKPVFYDEGFIGA
ncbi:MAG: hypothetical protein QW099_03230 [Candidatus Bathyarchaeia archaeon]